MSGIAEGHCPVPWFLLLQKPHECDWARGQSGVHPARASGLRRGPERQNFQQSSFVGVRRLPLANMTVGGGFGGGLPCGACCEALPDFVCLFV